MKKTVAVALILVMALALFACAGGNDGNNTSPANNEPSAGASGSPSASASASPSGSASASSTPASSEPSILSDPFAKSDSTVGFVSDDVDHWARDPYNVIYYSTAVSILVGGIAEALEQFGKTYNFTLEHLTANGDRDAYFNILNTVLLKNPDGLIIDVQPEMSSRAAEILEENNLPAISLQNKPVDSNGVCLVPCVIMDQIHNGNKSVEFLNNVYKDYWGDIDRSEIMLLILDYSSSIDINLRSQGAEQKWKELFGDQPFIIGDVAAESFTPEGGYNVTNSIISTNPNVKYWFIYGSTEDITLGATRAVEDLGKDDTVLTVATGVSVLPREWDAGYEGSWIAIYYVPPALYAGPAVFGLLALMDGRATNDTLWQDYFLAGDKAARFTLNADVVPKSRYLDYNNEILRGFGIDT